MPLSYICDWSHWQGDLNPKKIQEEGFAGVKLKVGGAIRQDWSFVDPKFLGNAKRLIEEAPDLVRMCYWYLMPGNPVAQFGLLIDTLAKVGGHINWHVQLDVEQNGLTSDDVCSWAIAWTRYTDDRTFSIYTQRNFWVPRIEDVEGTFGAWCTTILEEAHWVAIEDRRDPKRPYASQQSKAIRPEWWNVGYSGWKEATLLQFTDSALVDGRVTCASVYRGTRAELKKHLGVLQ